MKKILRTFKNPIGRHYFVSILLLGLNLSMYSGLGFAKDHPVATAGLVREFSSSPEFVHQGVQTVLHDQIIHGTLVYDKQPILTGAEAVESTPLFEPWDGPGDVYYKILKNAIAPRHFLESADQGTIAVRYIVMPVSGGRIRVRIDAVYVESAHHVVHISDGTVEKMEMKEIKDRIDSVEEASLAAEEEKRRKNSAEIVHQTYVRQKEDETTRLSAAQSAEKQLQQQVDTLRHEIERRVKQPGTDLKAAPFQSAATLKSLVAGTELAILIITPHWLGVETTAGQRGWIQVEKLEQLP
ncbi:MAG TPA: hypothetical protein VGH37_07285 [Candidatus Acidoferrum sp.]|jgi:hypothetical protein